MRFSKKQCDERVRKELIKLSRRYSVWWPINICVVSLFVGFGIGNAVDEIATFFKTYKITVVEHEAESGEAIVTPIIGHPIPVDKNGVPW